MATRSTLPPWTRTSLHFALPSIAFLHFCLSWSSLRTFVSNICSQPQEMRRSFLLGRAGGLQGWVSSGCLPSSRLFRLWYGGAVYTARGLGLVLLFSSGVSCTLIISTPHFSLFSLLVLHIFVFRRRSKPGWHFPDAPGGTCCIWTYFKDARIYR